MNLEFVKFEDGVSRVCLEHRQILDVISALEYGTINKQLAQAFREVMQAKGDRPVRSK